MRVAVVLDHRFERTPDGAVWTDGPFPYSFFRRYLSRFDEVRPLARVAAVEQAGERRLRADGEGVRFTAAPNYVGPWQYLARRGPVRRATLGAIRAAEAVILRVPSQLAACVAGDLLAGGRPFGAEVVGDPYDALTPRAGGYRLGALYRWYHVRRQRALCRSAVATAYVTRHALQRRYPPGEARPSMSYSSVELPEAAFAAEPRGQRPGPLRIVTVGSLEHRYKGVDTLLEALAICRSGGLDFELRIVGAGRRQAELEALGRRLGLLGKVRFLGRIPAGEAVRAELDRADLFVLASRQEGLPRSLIEAMARGLPAIATRVGGIAELLEEDRLAPPEDAAALGARIGVAGRDPEGRARAAARNLRRAREFHDDVLSGRRAEFYEAVATASERWLSAARPRG